MTVTAGAPIEVRDVVTTEEVRPGVLLIRLNRPDQLNAMTADLIQRLRDILHEVRDDAGVRAIILTGNGSAFCAGLDLRGYGQAPGNRGVEGRPQAGLRVQKHIADLHEAFRGARAPVIAAINGAAAGGGMSLSLFADIRMMAKDAKLHAAFIKRGLSACDIGASWLLPRIVGFSRASEILLTGRDIDAREALEIGLASSVHEPQDLLAAAIEKAELIVSNSPMGVWMTKEVLWSNLEIPSLRAGIDLENRTQILCSLTKDHREAVSSFLEKRPAEYLNR
ncbi:enoyl-CoA hydratase/isomerase family protein [Actinomadura rugatobispora]|uniref:Enoyl-CoA hydratase/isomerase family protein n=1 Tax=Actinomadura rugatobispora TaxID=1994 RepID=A0ABW0ZV91_9ACTN|nr:enoyl-CoA hydratase/isomerase family protein [Actinomadura rugatobispora]